MENKLKDVDQKTNDDIHSLEFWEQPNALHGINSLKAKLQSKKIYFFELKA